MQSPPILEPESFYLFLQKAIVEDEWHIVKPPLSTEPSTDTSRDTNNKWTLEHIPPNFAEALLSLPTTLLTYRLSSWHIPSIPIHSHFFHADNISALLLKPPGFDPRPPSILNNPNLDSIPKPWALEIGPVLLEGFSTNTWTLDIGPPYLPIVTEFSSKMWALDAVATLMAHKLLERPVDLAAVELECETLAGLVVRKARRYGEVVERVDVDVPGTGCEVLAEMWFPPSADSKI